MQYIYIYIYILVLSYSFFNYLNVYDNNQGVAQETTTIYWYVGGDDPFVTWIQEVSDEEYPPTSNSISWGGTEQAMSKSSMNTFNTEARNLGLRGVTITVSSGDNGAPGDADYCDYDSGSSISSWEVYIKIDYMEVSYYFNINK